jgi:hypothetical protein
MIQTLTNYLSFLNNFYHDRFSFPGRFSNLNSSSVSLVTSKEVQEIYAREKDNILSFFRPKFYQFWRVEILWVPYPALMRSFKVLYALETKELLKCLLSDASDNLLITFLFSLRDCRNILVFTNTLCLRIAAPPFRKMVMEDIFDNFMNFLSWDILSAKLLNWSSSKDSLNGYFLLGLFRTLWNRELYPLGSSMSKSEDLKKMEKLIEDRLIFYEIFFDFRTEDLLILEYPNVLSDIRNSILKITHAVRNFCFLAFISRCNLKIWGVLNSYQDLGG